MTRAVVVRGIGFALAVALGAVAIWLIVTSSSQKHLQLGVLAGLWGLLIGAFSMFGSRRHPAEQATTPTVGTELQLRSRATEVESASDVAERRAHEARLEQLLRQEIRDAVNREVGSLRAEISQLRSDLLEKVGAQVRLERIETTRVISSDLEALQDEVRALKAAAREPLFGVRSGSFTSGRTSSTIDVGTMVEREVVERAVVDAPKERPSTPPAAAPPAAESPTSTSQDRSRTQPNNGAPAQPPAAPARSPQGATAQGATAQGPAAQGGPSDLTGPIAPVPPADGPARPAQPQSVEPQRAPSGPPTFANLPRLTPFVEDPLPDLPPSRAAAPGQHGNGATPQAPSRAAQQPANTPPEQARTPSQAPQQARPRGPAGRPTGPITSTPPTYVRPPAAPPGPPSYEGRRRRGDGVESSSRPGDAPSNGLAAGQDDSSGRRRRAEDKDDNLLARLLERETR